MIRNPLLSLPVLGLALALLSGALAGCAPLVVAGAAAGTALMITDRRTSGAQIDDEAIELRSSIRLREQLGDRVHINVTSYNRQVLLTGEVPTPEMKQQAEQIVARVDNVRGVVNELAIMSPTTLPQRSADVLITGKVRASLVDAADLHANAFKVVTERGNVYLMGRVTQREADRGTQIARQIRGVQRVVRIFEIATPQELRSSGVTLPAADMTPVRVAPAAADVPGSASIPASAEAGPPASDGGAVVTPIR